MATRLTVKPMTIAGLSVHGDFVTALWTLHGHGGGIANQSSLQLVFNTPLLGGL
jgi:hypothetical protein